MDEKQNLKWLIIEGTDCSGKTTLINKLIKDDRFKDSILVRINAVPFGNVTLKKQEKLLKNYYEFIENLRKLSLKFVIFDRFYPSEMVYSKFKGYEGLTSISYKQLNKFFSKEDHLIVHVNPGIDEVLKRYENRGDDKFDKETDKRGTQKI